MHRKYNTNNSVETTEFNEEAEPKHILQPNDLLPGIEDFLCSVLAKESLTPEAEEQRQYFVERLDIIKLPPSVPPRPQSLGLKLYPVTNGTLPTHNSSNDSVPEFEDFAAHQRELSRLQVAKGNTSTASEEVEEVKVYDDIEPKDDSAIDGSQTQHEDEDSMYEIPQIKRNLSDSGYEKAIDPTALAKICESPTSEESMPPPAVPQPPPLPPRRERTASDAASRSSIASMLEEKLVANGLKPEQQFSTSSNEDRKSDTISRSEKSTDDLLGENTGDEVDAVSVDSLDPDGGVKLPRAMKKKKHHHKVSHSLSAPLCDISNAFCDLEDVLLSGELFYKNTLSSTKHMVALSNTSLICYKHDKRDSKPVLVIPLTGYRASFHKRHSRISYEMQLYHDELEDHFFLIELKQWAQTWCDYINSVADGSKVPGPFYNLVKTRTMEPTFGSTYDLTKSSSQMFGSSTSVCSVDAVESGSVKAKKRNNSGNRQRIGSIVSRASQILDNFKLLKKSPSTPGPAGPDQLNIPDESKGAAKENSIKRERTSNSDKNSNNKAGDSNSKDRTKTFSSSGDSVLELGTNSEPQSPLSPLTPESGVFYPTVITTEVPKRVKHQGSLTIYSSFNKRKWGRRWCKVCENNFECYRNQATTVCELEFPLRDCILRRAIEETKSQLGLMLLQNNREKITIEPMCWSELGSWLRVLMRETSTPKAPEGLEGYMEEVIQYHDIDEDTTEVDLDPLTESQLSPGDVKTPTNLGNNKTTESWRNSYRDSGNCSAESVDGKSELSERTSVHPEFSDSSLPRVNVYRTGDVYTQVRKSSVASMSDNQKGAETNDDSSIPINKVPSTNDNRSLDFGSTEDNLNALEGEHSMIDEVLSKFTSQISTGYEADKENEYEIIENVRRSQSLDTQLNQSDVNKDESTFIENRRLSRDLTELDVISPIKESLEADSSEISRHEKFLCSSFVDDNQAKGEGLMPVLSKSSDAHSGIVIDAVDNRFESDSKMEQSNTIVNKSDVSDSAINETDSNKMSENSNKKSEKSNIQSVMHEDSEDVKVSTKQSEQCVEDLAHVLSNLSLEDKGNKDGDVIGADKGENKSTNETVKETPEASCDKNAPVPFDSSTDYLDEDARTRRSVVMREMAETGGDVDRTLKELRIKLVQLKKDRISIHHRMQQMSDSGKVHTYLEDEYTRLDREVDKVKEEIACLEQLQREQKMADKKQFFDDDQEEIDV